MVTFMLNNVCIIGAGSHSHSVISILKENATNKIIGILDWAHDFNPAEEICGELVIGFANENYMSDIDFHKATTKFIVAVGDNLIRKSIYDSLDDRGALFVQAMSNTAVVNELLLISEGTVVGIGAIVNTNVHIGKNTIINSGALLEHDVWVGSHCHIGPGAIVCGSAVISDEVFVGAGAVILPKVEVAMGVIIGAGSVVTRDISDNNATYIGTPARRVK